MGKFIRKQWIFLGQSNSFVSEFVKSPEFYSWLNVDGLCDFFEAPVLKKGPIVLSLGKAKAFYSCSFLILSACKSSVANAGFLSIFLFLGQ